MDGQRGCWAFTDTSVRWVLVKLSFLLIIFFKVPQHSGFTKDNARAVQEFVAKIQPIIHHVDGMSVDSFIFFYSDFRQSSLVEFSPKSMRATRKLWILLLQDPKAPTSLCNGCSGNSQPFGSTSEKFRRFRTLTQGTIRVASALSWLPEDLTGEMGRGCVSNAGTRYLNLFFHQEFLYFCLRHGSSIVTPNS